MIQVHHKLLIRIDFYIVQTYSHFILIYWWVGYHIKGIIGNAMRLSACALITDSILWDVMLILLIVTSLMTLRKIRGLWLPTALALRNLLPLDQHSLNYGLACLRLLLGIVWQDLVRFVVKVDYMTVPRFAFQRVHKSSLMGGRLMAFDMGLVYCCIIIPPFQFFICGFI